MTGLYLFCAAVGIPLLLWFSFAGDADGFGEAEADGPLAFLSLSTMSFVLGFFGLTGLLLEIVGTAGLITLLVAIITAFAAGACNSAAFRWLRKNSNSSEVMDHELEGMIANVALPISGEHRGKIILTKAGAREQMTATPVDGSTIDPGERVVIVRVEGGVALVAPLGPDLELG
jgi:membrane protein implicated in regulation of membrane protease activity